MASDLGISLVTQTDFNFQESRKIGGGPNGKLSWLGGEDKEIAFTATIPNLLNQHAVTAYNQQIDSGQFATFLQPGGLPFYYGGQAYSAYEHPYNWQSLLNTNQITLDSQYGKPYLYQLSRNIRLGLKFTF